MLNLRKYQRAAVKMGEFLIYFMIDIYTFSFKYMVRNMCLNLSFTCVSVGASKAL